MNSTSFHLTPGVSPELPKSLAVGCRRQSKSPKDAHSFLIRCLSVVSSFEALLRSCGEKMCKYQDDKVEGTVVKACAG